MYAYMVVYCAYMSARGSKGDVLVERFSPCYLFDHAPTGRLQTGLGLPYVLSFLLLRWCALADRCWNWHLKCVFTESAIRAQGRRHASGRDVSVYWESTSCGLALSLSPPSLALSPSCFAPAFAYFFPLLLLSIKVWQALAIGALFLIGWVITRGANNQKVGRILAFHIHTCARHHLFPSYLCHIISFIIP